MAETSRQGSSGGKWETRDREQYEKVIVEEKKRGTRGGSGRGRRGVWDLPHSGMEAAGREARRSLGGNARSTYLGP